MNFFFLISLTTIFFFLLEKGNFVLQHPFLHSHVKYRFTKSVYQIIEFAAAVEVRKIEKFEQQEY